MLRTNVLDVKRFVNPVEKSEGGKAFVYHVSDTCTGESKAVKIYKPAEEEKALRDRRTVVVNGEELIWGTRDYEATVMELLNKLPHVVKLDGIINDYALENGIWVPREGSHGLVREWTKGQPLTSKVLYSSSESSKLVKQLIDQYLEAMVGAAKYGISFADIKPDDIIADASKREIRIVDLDLAEPLSESLDQRLRQWYADLIRAGKLVPDKFDDGGTPLFDGRPVDSLYVEFYLGQKIFGELYEIEKAKIMFTSQEKLLYLQSLINGVNPDRQKSARESINLSSVSDFVASLKDHPMYDILFRTFAMWGESLENAEHADRNTQSRTYSMFQSESCGWSSKIQNLFGSQVRFGPRELARIAFQMEKKN